ncbi:MAG TPA: nucleotidyltransferase domain-containing protein [Spirochaetia bacterium]|nr:nucleotidyltransferase domain-containing protein [Spirochaetia bacterium]
MTVVEKLHMNGVDVDFDKLTHLAHHYSITEISVFGSSIRSDMKPGSDIDLLISFSPSAEISLFDLMDLESELEQLFHRQVDIVEPQALTNPVRRRSILSSKELLYAS